jgi:hypothetical protein
VNWGIISPLVLQENDLYNVVCAAQSLSPFVRQWLHRCFTKAGQVSPCYSKGIRLVYRLLNEVFPFLNAPKNFIFPRTDAEKDCCECTLKAEQRYLDDDQFKYPSRIQFLTDRNEPPCSSCHLYHGKSHTAYLHYTRPTKSSTDCAFTETDTFDIEGLSQAFFRRTVPGVRRTFITVPFPCIDPVIWRSVLQYKAEDLLYKAYHVIGQASVASLYHLAIKALVLQVIRAWLTLEESQHTLRLCWHRFRFHFLDFKNWKGSLPRHVLEDIIEIRDRQLRQLVWSTLNNPHYVSLFETPSGQPRTRCHLPVEVPPWYRELADFITNDSEDRQVQAITFSVVARFY